MDVADRNSDVEMDANVAVVCVSVNGSRLLSVHDTCAPSTPLLTVAVTLGDFVAVRVVDNFEVIVIVSVRMACDTLTEGADMLCSADRDSRSVADSDATTSVEEGVVRSCHEADCVNRSCDNVVE